MKLTEEQLILRLERIRAADEVVADVSIPTNDDVAALVEVLEYVAEIVGAWRIQSGQWRVDLTGNQDFLDLGCREAWAFLRPRLNRQLLHVFC